MLNVIKKLLGIQRYESSLDQFLHAFDHQHPAPSLSQQKEIYKYAEIYQLRDHQHMNNKLSTQFWENF